MFHECTDVSSLNMIDRPLWQTILYIYTAFCEVNMTLPVHPQPSFTAVNKHTLPNYQSKTTYVVGVSDGYAVIDSAKYPNQGVKLLIWFCGRQQYAYWAGAALITDDGEAIEGDALDDVRLVGVVTHTIHPVSLDENPFM